VVPAESITGITADAAAAGEWPEPPEASGGPAEPYLVFIKRQARGTHEHCGEVQAASPAEALRRAVSEMQVSPALVYWVCPQRSVLASNPQEQASFFAPAQDKPYRDQAYYHTDSLLRELKRGGTEPDGR
jgi:1,2-phenylacetyl-CoA epoxidase PaaB subunit